MKVTIIAQITPTRPGESVEKGMEELSESFAGPGLQALEISGNTVYLVLED